MRRGIKVTNFCRFVGILILGILLSEFAIAQESILGSGVFGGTKTSSYKGPGDVVSGAFAYWALRAYTAAIASAATQSAVNLSRASDSHTCDIAVASNGGLGLTQNCSTGGDNGTAVVTWCNSTTCSITKAYDQTLGDNCNSATCDVSQTTAADQPTITFSAIGSLPMMTFNGTSDVLFTPTNLATQAQPYTFSAVSKFTGSSHGDVICFGNTATPNSGAGQAANQLGMFAGSTLTATAADGSYHARQDVYNSTSSVLYVDGTANTGNTGTGAPSGSSIQIGDCMAFSTFWTPTIGEVGMWASAFNSTQQSNMNSNEHSYWGF